jgi:arylsulfatase A-like enzyme
MKQEPQRPNLLVIQTDQLSSWALSCYGGHLVPTPHIDALAEEGVRFDNFFANSAVCTPSRGSFLTGRYPHSHGAYRNGEALNEDEITIASVLSGHGYATGYAGKWHLDGVGYRIVPKDKAMGFEDCRYMINGHYKEVCEDAQGDLHISANIGNETTYMTDWLADKTVQFLEQAPQQPFFFMVSFPDPHQPFKVRAPYDTMFSPDAMTIPASFYQERLPDWADEDEWGRKRYFPLDRPHREQALRHIMAQYCGEVKCIDDNVGKIVRCLKQMGLFDNTLIVFTTDHGEYMGEHGLLEKNNLYETAYRIPLIMRCTSILPAGQVMQRFVSMVDMQQTLLGLLGVPPCGREQGRDASPLLRGEPIQWEDEVYIHPNDVPRAGIFTPEYELAYVGRGWKREQEHEFRDHVLFDRRSDPEQLHNRFGDPQAQDIVSELTDRIVRHHLELGTDLSALPKVLHSHSCWANR